jgi:AraC family transcriptional regulator, regulatory protein of adaptative response / DNA-3-methyladenine glycosylase II
MLTLPIDPDACYLALKSRDARFDGQFFTGVTSTKIYCRPVCRVKAPKRENCEFYANAAQAESAGFRPCLRCRPELAPQRNEPVWSTEDASKMLSAQAMSLLGAAALQGDAYSVSSIAARLGISERHMLRITMSHLGVSPLQYLQTRRLLAAKSLLTDTKLPISSVALSSGFGSLRSFNAAFLRHYGMPPTRLRKEGKLGPSPLTGSRPRLRTQALNSEGYLSIQLGFRPPFDAQALLIFCKERQLDTMELIAVTADSIQANPSFFLKNTPLNIVRSFSFLHQAQQISGWLATSIDLENNCLRVRMSEAFAPALPAVITRIRAAFDLDADPAAIDAALGSSFSAGLGMRVPGSLEGFEVAVRAILGQQVTVAAARTLTQRVLNRYGEPIQTPWPQITRCFPTPQALAAASTDDLGKMGIVRQRQAALIALSQAVASGELNLNSPPNPLQVISQLRALPGIGEWTANYIAMRALRWPDAFPAGDIVLHTALGLRDETSPTRRARAAELASLAWRPWRSYAVFRAWAGMLRKAS